MTERLLLPEHFEAKADIEHLLPEHIPDHEIATPDAEISDKTIENLRKAAETHATSNKETPIDQYKEHPPSTVFSLHSQLKSDAYKKTLEQTQQKLPTPQRAFSKVVHAAPIEALSGAAAKTIGRPSGIMGGACGALAGSAYVLNTAKQIGYSYNYSAFAITFIGGFALGLLLELVIRAIRGKQ